MRITLGKKKTKKKTGEIPFQRNNIAEPAIVADGAGRTAFRGMTSFQPAPPLNVVVQREHFRILKRLFHSRITNAFSDIG
jgi:hypothetical protein